MNDPKATGAGTTVPVDHETAQVAKNAVAYFKILKNRGKDSPGPTALRSFWNQAGLRYAMYLQATHNEGRAFKHCDQLPRGRTKRG